MNPMKDIKIRVEEDYDSAVSYDDDYDDNLDDTTSGMIVDD